MNTQNWLTLMEYSATHRVSLSTLRRRIKAGEIEYKFIEGKYVLKNVPMPSPGNHAGPETIAPPSSVLSQSQPLVVPSAPVKEQRTDELLAEIKKAFQAIVQEKDQHIRTLKEEIADLKTLVRVLEEDNSRLKVTSASTLDLDLGLEA